MRALSPIPSIWVCRDLCLDLAPAPRLLGIVNTTPDSFHADSRQPDPEAAYQHAARLLHEGADALDIGGQSTRPGYVEIPPAEEIARTTPVLRRLAATHPGVPLSIDTYQPAVAEAALAAGAHILNDIQGLQGSGGPELARLAARYGAGVIIMHHDPTLRDRPDEDPLPSILAWLARSLDLARLAGIAPERIVLDPGVGFGKTPAQNAEVLRRCHELHALGLPVLLAVSRKSVFGHLVPELNSAAERLEATLAATAIAVTRGIRLHRVHDVAANRRAALTAATF